jgi:magnesium transporter
VGTFYGMNVNVPGGVQTGSWTFLGAYTTFIVVIMLSLVVPAAWMIWIFRRLKWI